MRLALAVLGLLAGLLQTRMLWRASHGRSGPLSFVPRMALVAAVLVAGALCGAIGHAAAGWGAGFAAGVLLHVRRRR